MSRLFGMSDLQELVASALVSGDYLPADSARIRPVPDTRTIRYYTTLGLLKPPAKMQGRTALYNESHVLQLVAIKRLQAQEMSLSDIQQRLEGLPNSRLASLAGLPADFWTAADRQLEKRKRQRTDRFRQKSETTETVAAPPSAADEPFWLTPAALPENCPKPIVAEGTSGSVQPLQVQATVELWLRTGVRLNVTLTSSGDQPAIDAAAIQAAAQPLIEELIRQKLIRP